MVVGVRPPYQLAKWFLSVEYVWSRDVSMYL